MPVRSRTGSYSDLPRISGEPLVQIRTVWIRTAAAPRLTGGIADRDICQTNGSRWEGTVKGSADQYLDTKSTCDLLFEGIH